MALDQHGTLKFETDTYLMSCNFLGPSAVLNPNTKLDRRSYILRGACHCPRAAALLSVDQEPLHPGETAPPNTG